MFSGLSNPTALRFSPDGRIFVAEKNGRIKVFDNLADTTPTLFADLSTNVYNFWDRGLLGLALDPAFPTQPYVYVLYTYDHELGSTAPAPRWGTPGVLSDPCPTPPGPTADGCVVSGRLSRLQASGNVMVGSEQVLIEDWCQQYPSHSTGSLAFGADGALYASGGDGASFNFADWGQDGSPLNPCGDPPGAVGSALSPPTAEGGALRSQDLRTSGDPVSLDGAIIRVDPATGAGLPDNPLATSTDPNARRIIAYGLRNPFRINVRPGTNEVWVGDVGWTTWEEINRLVDPGGPVAENFGWPCYEGQGRQPGYDGANLNICENLYGQAGAVTGPYFTYNHSSQVVAGETCPTGSSSVSGIDFYQGGPYPASYDGALFFADYSRDCIWAMKADASGLPAPGLLESFVAPAANPVDVQISPAGELFYADFDGGTIRRIQFVSANQPPVAVAAANPTSGAAPLTVTFDGSGSSDPDGDPITHAWDLDGDGLFDDSTAAQPTFTYTQSGSFTARLQVTDSAGASSLSGPIVITVGNTPPTATINAPSASLTWRVGDVINFSGIGHRPAGRDLARLRALVVADSQSLPVQLSLPSASRLCGRVERLVHRPRPRVSVESRARPDRHRLRRSHEHGKRHAAAPDGQPNLHLESLGAPARGQRRQCCDAVHAHGHREVDQHDLGALAADPERRQLRVRLLVGRRRPDARHHRERRDDLQRHLPRSTYQHESTRHHRADPWSARASRRRTGAGRARPRSRTPTNGGVATLPEPLAWMSRAPMPASTRW